MKKRHVLVTTLLAVVVSSGIFAQAVVNWPGGMYALSCDGNQHDKDDFVGTPLAIALMYYAGLSDKIVHINHSNHLGNNNVDWENKMITATEGGASRFGGLNQNLIFNCQDGVSPVRNHFLAQAQNANASNPLWYICAGPMEVAWQCLDAVRDNAPDKLQYIHCVSHSSWNETHDDNLKMNHQWSDMKSDFPPVTVHDIIDQNSSDGDFDFNTPDSYWFWLKNSDNPDWVWLYNRDEKTTFDPSDAGMTYWLISGGPNGGDQRGGWPETKDLFENFDSGDPTANAGADQAVADADGNGSESVSLNGSASTDSDGTISSYVWTEGGLQIATGATPNVTLSVGAHTITLTVTDNDGNTDSDQVTITVSGIVSLPGIIQAEDFTAQSGVQTESTSDAGGGLNVGYINNGDWTEYEVAVQQSGTYTLDLRVASGLNGGTISILSDGTNIGSANVNVTGGWQSWTTVSTTVSLTEGAQTIRFAYSGASGFLLNINWVEFSTSGPQDPIANAGSNQTVNDADDSGDETVTLNGTGSSDPDGTIESYVWTKDGTQIATGVSPSVSLPVGVHDITLTVTDNNGATASDNVTVTVTGYVNQAPVANAGADQVLTDSDDNGSELVTLDASASSDTDGTIVSYVWTEGGSQIATGVSPEVSFTVGTHTVILMVTDDNGASSTDEVVIVIDAGGCNGLPIAGIIEAEDYTAQSGVQTESTSDANGGLNVGWINNGDYTEYEVCVAESGSYNVDIRVAAAQNGGTINILENGIQVGSVAVSVTGGWQSWVTVSTTVNLSQGAQALRLAYSGGSGFLLNINWMEFTSTGPQAPIAQAGNNQTLTDSDDDGIESVTLSGSGSSDPDGTITSYVWLEGGSQIATGVSPTINLGVGTHTITLIVTDNDGATASDNVSITIQEAPTGYITISEVRTDCNHINEPRNVIVFNVSGTSETPTINKGTLLNDGGGNYRIRDIDIAFGSTTTYNISVAGETVSETVTAVSSCLKKAIESVSDNLPEVEVYPNPAKDQLYIALSDQDLANYSIISLTGSIMANGQIVDGQRTIDITGIQAGLYVIVIQSENQVIRKEIVVY